MNSIVVTTINDISKGINAFEGLLNNWNIILVGDLKTPALQSSKKRIFLSIDDQKKQDFEITKLLPFNHYTRKNIGYLEALRVGSELIYDTDDDNIPYETWGFPDMDFKGELIIGEGFFNSYLPFYSERIWPRGFPLNSILVGNKGMASIVGESRVGVWQGLADKDPDVDAIYRLVDYREILFKKREPLVLQRGVYCPFNSQNTLWSREMMPYAYLPSTVSFRFTDILRGYIAQRCLWEHDMHLGFTEATVYQERNEHDLMKDFESEIPCYLHIDQLVGVLNNLSLSRDFSRNLVMIYNELEKLDLVTDDELKTLKAWNRDIEKLH